MNFQANVNFVCIRSLCASALRWASAVTPVGMYGDRGNQNGLLPETPFWEDTTTYIGFNSESSPYERRFEFFSFSFLLLHGECYEIISIMKVSAQKLRIEENILHILPYLSI